MTNTTPKNGKNPFKIYINIEEEIKKEAKNNNDQSINDQKIDLIDKDILDTPVETEEETKEKNVKDKKPKEIPKIKVLEVASWGVEVKDPDVELKTNILVKNVERKKKIRKFIKIWGVLIFFVSILWVWIFSYYNKQMVASLLGINSLERQIIKTDYQPLKMEDFSPNTRFFYEVYLRDYDYIYKTLKSKDKTNVLSQLNATVWKFIKNKIDYATFRLNYSRIVYPTYKNILKSTKKMDNMKMQPPDGGEVIDKHLSPEK